MQNQGFLKTHPVLKFFEHPVSIKVCQGVFAELLSQARCTPSASMNIGALIPKSTLEIRPNPWEISSFDRMMSQRLSHCPRKLRYRKQRPMPCPQIPLYDSTMTLYSGYWSYRMISALFPLKIILQIPSIPRAPQCQADIHTSIIRSKERIFDLVSEDQYSKPSSISLDKSLVKFWVSVSSSVKWKW